MAVVTRRQSGLTEGAVGARRAASAVPTFPRLWRDEAAYTWELGDPLPSYPGATYRLGLRVWAIGAQSHTLMLPVGSASYCGVGRLTRADAFRALVAPSDPTERRNLTRQVRGSARLARALGAMVTIDPGGQSHPTWSPVWDSAGMSPTLAAWRLELRRAQGYAVGTHHSARQPIPAQVKREVRARFDATGRICELCHRHVDSDDQVHFDHIEPWWARGTDLVSNLRVVHADCNRHRQRGVGGFGGYSLRGLLKSSRG
jgi:hypothetical protein